MQANFIHWLESILEQGIPDFWAWKLYTFPPGNHPWILHTESAAYPEGIWWSRKLPASYYSNKTVSYHWPSDLRSWSQWLRESKLSTFSTDAYSYKQWQYGVLQSTSSPYSKVSFWELCIFLFTGGRDESCKAFFTVGQEICLFQSQLFDLRILYRPYYYDEAWNEWFPRMENINHNIRYGVCRTQLNLLHFLRAFFFGYWFGFLSDLPWPHRIRLPRDVSGWRWLKMMRNFFRTYNPTNPKMLILSLAFLAISYIYSPVTEYVSGTPPSKGSLVLQIILWLHFIVSTFLVLVPLARLSKVLNDYRRDNGLLLPFRDRLCVFIPQSISWRNRIMRVVMFVFHWGLVGFCLFLVWALTPLWGYIPLLIGKIFWFLLKGVYFLSTKLGFFLHYIFWKVAIFLFVSVFDLECTSIGEFILSEKVWLWVDSCIRSYDFFRFYLRTIPWIFLGLFCWVVAIIWPLLYPYLRKAVIRKFPWAFVTEISAKTRIKYGFYLLYMYLRRKIF